MTDQTLSNEIVAKAVELGYDGCGTLRLQDLNLPLYAERLDKKFARFPEAMGIKALDIPNPCKVDMERQSCFHQILLRNARRISTNWNSWNG